MKLSIRILLAILLVSTFGCSERKGLATPTKSAQTTVSGTISLKDFRTGQLASDELKSAKDKPFTWTYFAEPRIVTYDSLEDGTVTEIEFGLESSWEGYELRDELEKKFRESGSPAFRFHCVSEAGSVDFTDKRFRVTDEQCFAFDKSQTLVISRRWPKYEEPLLDQFPSLKLLVDRASVSLYDDGLKKKKADIERARLREKIAEDDKKAAEDM